MPLVFIAVLLEVDYRSMAFYRIVFSATSPAVDSEAGNSGDCANGISSPFKGEGLPRLDRVGREIGSARECLLPIPTPALSLKRRVLVPLKSHKLPTDEQIHA